MTESLNELRLEVYRKIQATQDPPEMPRRATVLKYEGHPDRCEYWMPILITRWQAHRMMEVMGEVR